MSCLAIVLWDKKGGSSSKGAKEGKRMKIASAGSLFHSRVGRSAKENERRNP